MKAIAFNQGRASFETHFSRQARLAGVMQDSLHINGVRTPLMSMAERAGVKLIDTLPAEESPNILHDDEKLLLEPELSIKLGETVLGHEVSLDVEVPDDASSITEEESVKV